MLFLFEIVSAVYFLSPANIQYDFAHGRRKEGAGGLRLWNLIFSC